MVSVSADKAAGEQKPAAATAATRPTWDKGRDRFMKVLSGWRPPYFLPMQYSDWPSRT
jgi:hypothetical protein